MIDRLVTSTSGSLAATHNGRMPSDFDPAGVGAGANPDGPGPADASDPIDPIDPEADADEPADAGSDEPLDPFEELVFAALDSLPPAFRDRLGSVAIVVEDEPTTQQLASAHAFGLLGLYTGVPRTAYGATNAAVASKITIFRGPHLRQFRDPDSLARGVAETVRHEVAHHFGISDARLTELAHDRQRR
jgi:predicted Zn-dependent protease with MMP-like domain